MSYQHICISIDCKMTVAPLVGAWIETFYKFLSGFVSNCRPSRRGVD